MTDKRKNPYTLLQEECREWAHKVSFAHLEVKEDGLRAIYVKRAPDAPWSIRP